MPRSHAGNKAADAMLPLMNFNVALSANLRVGCEGGCGGLNWRKVFDLAGGDGGGRSERCMEKKAQPDTAVVLMNFLIRVSSRDVADLYFTPDLLLNTLFHGSQVSR